MSVQPPSDHGREPDQGPGKNIRWIGLAFFLLIAVWWFSSFFSDVF